MFDGCFADGSELVEEYSLQTGELQRMFYATQNVHCWPRHNVDAVYVASETLCSLSKQFASEGNAMSCHQKMIGRF